MRETSDKPQFRDILQNSWLVSLKTVKVIKKNKVWEIATTKGSLKGHSD